MPNKTNEISEYTGKPIKRHYSVPDKKRIVEEVIQGIYSKYEAIDRYKINDRTLDSWLITYSDKSGSPFSKKVTDKVQQRFIVAQILSGALTKAEAARQNEVTTAAICRWIARYKSSDNLLAENIPQVMARDSNDTDAQIQIEALKLKVIALETMIDIAEDQFKIDIRKKCGTKQQ